MVHPAFTLVFRAAFAAAALSLAAPAEATLYKWVHPNGEVTYSNVPPPESAAVREVETIENDREPTATELRTRQILEEAARERAATGGSDPIEAPPTAARGTGARAGHGDSEAGTKYEWVPQAARPAIPAAIQDSASWRYPAATPVTVRDPCLLSADPRCYEVNAANYDPYLGYAPTRGEIPAAPVGAARDEATGTTGAIVTLPAQAPGSSTVGAAVVPAAQVSSPAPRPFRGLPPGTPVLSISR